jgi:hypothetical protein
MSQGERVCSSCGKPVPIGARRCPNCGRLFIDRRAERLGADKVDTTRPQQPLNDSASATTTESESDAPSPPPKDSSPPDGQAETDSFYAIAPEYHEPCPKCDKGVIKNNKCTACGYTPPSSGGSSCCGPCAVLFVLMTWIISLVYLL